MEETKYSKFTYLKGNIKLVILAEKKLKNFSLLLGI
jgi:hypothetical protein